MATDTNDKKKEGDLKSFFKKIFWWGLGIFIVIIAGLAWLGGNTDKFFAWQSARYDKAMKEYEDKLVAQYTADKDGGSTPEETIDLFIAALKAGDIEQASKYYVLDKQEEELRHLRDDILDKYGDLQKSIYFYSRIKENGIKKCVQEGDWCKFEFGYIRTENATTTAVVSGQKIVLVALAGEEEIDTIGVSLNSFSGVWKIDLP